MGAAEHMRAVRFSFGGTSRGEALSSESSSDVPLVATAPLDGDVATDVETVSPIRRVLSKLRGSYLVELAVIVVAALIIASFTHGFLSVGNIRAIVESASITGIVAVTATMVTLSGNFFSLSTAQSAIFGAIFFAAMMSHGWNVALAIFIVLSRSRAVASCRVWWLLRA